ncbi:MAG: SRPBCC domain-containing protein [Acidimicrobiales bacterium]
MSALATVRLAIRVTVDPQEAFRVFTEEIDAWYRRGPHSFLHSKRAIGIRVEPGVGGRLVEVHDAETGEGVEMGRIRVWEPGRRLLFVERRGSEVDIRFDPADGGTRVVLEHRGLERLAPRVADAVGRYGSRALLEWFRDYLDHRARQGV